MEIIKNTEALSIAINDGLNPKYVFFWGHTQKRENEIEQSCFSQWFSLPFEQNGIQYQTAEHYMMEKKALLFGDEDSAEKILRSKSPGEAKALGRKILNFNEDTWLKNRWEIVVAGNLAKFGNNVNILNYLIGTGDRVLVEASPVDRIWGIGLDLSLIHI